MTNLLINQVFFEEKKQGCACKQALQRTKVGTGIEISTLKMSSKTWANITYNISSL